jgi:hypothetical protein
MLKNTPKVLGNLFRKPGSTLAVQVKLVLWSVVPRETIMRFVNVFFTLFILVQAQSLAFAQSPGMKPLSSAVRQRNYVAVQMRLRNAQPDNMLEHFGNNYETLLWLALFGGAGLPQSEDLPFSDAQQKIAACLLEAAPRLIDEPVLTPPRSPLAAAFNLYSLASRCYGRKGAEAIADRIRFLVRNGAQFEGDIVRLKKGSMELPLFLAVMRKRNEFDLALELGVDLNHYYLYVDATTEQKVLLLDVALSEMLTRDSEAFEDTMYLFEKLLGHGADMFKSVNSDGEHLSFVYKALLVWDKSTAIPDQIRAEQLHQRFERLFSLLLEHGLKPEMEVNITQPDGSIFRISIMNWAATPQRARIASFFTNRQGGNQRCERGLSGAPKS